MDDYVIGQMDKQCIQMLYLDPTIFHINSIKIPSHIDISYQPAWMQKVIIYDKSSLQS